MAQQEHRRGRFCQKRSIGPSPSIHYHYGGSDGTKRRHGHITSIFWISSTNYNEQHVRAVDFFVNYIDISIFLALKHVKERSGEILPYLPERLKDCDLDLTWEHRDSMTMSTYASTQFLDAINPKLVTTNRHPLKSNENLAYEKYNEELCIDLPSPMAILGGALSSVSETLNILGQAFQVPQISPTATSTELDKKPFFSRTVPTNTGDAIAIALYLQHLGVSHVGLLYMQDLWGRAFHADLARELRARDIQFMSTSIANDAATNTTINSLAESKLRYFVGIVNSDVSEHFFTLAHQHGIMGHSGYTWLLTEGSSSMLSDAFSVPRGDDLAAAIHGSAVISVDFDSDEAYERSLYDFYNNKTLQEEYISLHNEPDIFKNYTFPKPSTSLYQYFAFDAAIALGIASCETPGLFTGQELQQTMLNMNFTGVSGPVSFDKLSGNRDTLGLHFSVRNILVSDNRSTATDIFFTSEMAVTIDIHDKTITQLQPLIYSDNSTIIPASLPIVEENMNLIHPAAQVVGLLICGVVVLSSIACFVWTLKNRDHLVIRSSQPFFLCQLCVGTIIMSAAIIPSSFQEPMSKHQLDSACMAVPWLFSVGFVTAFSALFSKSWRLNKILEGSRTFKRIKVTPKDVMLPFFVLIFINMLSFTLCLILDPLVWTRIELGGRDKFGRSMESYGACRPKKDDRINPIFIALPLSINALSVLLALYHIYKGRKIPTGFSEASNIGLSILLLLETASLAVPLLFAVSTFPTADFVLRSMCIAICCFDFLFPIFAPKAKLLYGLVKPQRSASLFSSVINDSRLWISAEGYDLRYASESKSDIGISLVHRNPTYYQQANIECTSDTSQHSNYNHGTQVTFFSSKRSNYNI